MPGGSHTSHEKTPQPSSEVPRISSGVFRCNSIDHGLFRPTENPTLSVRHIRQIPEGLVLRFSLVQKLVSEESWKPVREQPPNRAGMSAQSSSEHKMRTRDPIPRTFYHLSSSLNGVKPKVRVIQSAARFIIESAEKNLHPSDPVHHVRQAND
jgi:hypothetical protein